MNETNNKLSGGVHCAESQQDTQERRPGRYLNEKSRAARLKKRRREKRLRVIVGVLAIVLLALIVVLGIKIFSGWDGFKGTWDMDGITMYQFDGSGKGASRFFQGMLQDILPIQTSKQMCSLALHSGLWCFQSVSSQS